MLPFLTRFGVLFLLMSLSLPALGQLTIEGEVTDERGAPLPGANIIVLDTPHGAAADRNGRFSFTIPSPVADITIEVRFVGYRTQRQTVTQREGTVELNFTLGSDALRMDEVVVTGASAAAERRQLGNAISSVSARDIDLSGGRAIDQILSGRIAGAQVMQNSGRAAGGVTIRLRGTSTVLGSADPLYVIDGVIVNNDSPELIRLGGYTQNRMVDINPNDIERIEVVKGAAAAALYGSRASNGVVQIFTRRGEIGDPRVTVTSRIQTDEIRRTIPVNMHPTDAAGNPVERYDFQDFIFRRAWGTEQHISVSGGAPGTRYSTSVAYNNNQGTVHNTNFERVNLRARLGQNVTEWLDLSVGALYSYNVNNEVPHGGMRDNWGALTGFIFGPNTYDPRPDPETGEYPTNGILANPIEVIDKFEFSYTTKRFVGDVQLTATPLTGLSIENVTGFDTHNQQGLIFIPRGTTAPAPYGQGHSRRAERDVLQFNNDLNIRYQRSLSDQLHSTTLVGHTFQYDEVSTFAAESEDLAPIARIVPSGARNLIVGEFRSERIIIGTFLQQTFGIANRLFLTGAVRADAASAFGEDERWQFYPKVSASYILSDERFWRESRMSAFIPELKLRASVGESGNWTAIGPYQRFTNYGISNYEGRPALIPSSTRGTPDIRPERQREIELGIDMSLLANRAAIEFTYYDQHTTDLLLNRSLAPTSGFFNQLVNVGTLDNKGFEVLLRIIPVQTRELQWTSTFIYSQNRNEVSGLEEDVLIFAGQGFGLVGARNGHPVGIFHGSAFERDANGDIVHDEAGLPVRAAENKIIGDPNPDFTASWTNELQIGRSWMVRAQFDAVNGNDVLNFTRRLGSLSVFGTTDHYEKELRGELPEGYNARVFGIFEHWVEDGSFIKLRELSVAYTIFPNFWGMNSLRFSLIGRNLFSIDNYNGYDPETNAEAQLTNVRGFDFVEPPIPRTFSFGVTMNF